MKSKVLIVTSIPLDEPVILNRLTPLIDQCIKRDYKVQLIAVDYPDTRVSGKLIRDNLTLDLYKSRYRSKHENLFIRLLRDLYLAFRLGRKLRKANEHSKIVVVTIPSMFLPMFTPRLSSEKQLSLDIRDLTWEYLIGNSFLGTCLGNVVRVQNRKAIKKFDLVSVTNKAELNYVRCTLGLSIKKIKIVANGVSESQFKELAELRNKSHTFKRPFIITYVGNVGIAQTFDTLIKVAEKLSDVRFNIIGSGARLQNIRSQVRGKGLKNVYTPGRVEWSSVINFYESTDLLFLSLDKGYTSAVPSKLYEYLAIGKPVVFIGNIDMKEQFKDFRGLYFCDDNVEALMSLLEQLKHTPSLSTNAINENREMIHSKFIRDRNWGIFLDELASRA